MSDMLFEVEGAAVAEPLSADRRRTLRQRRDVAFGIHPLTGGVARPDLGTCGDCRFRELYGHHNRTYPKCSRFGSPSHSAASDVRAWWPACGEHDLGDPKVGPDAARWKP